MNWLDIIIIVILILSGIKGFFTGLILSLTHLISIISGLIVAFKYYQPLVDYLNHHWHWVDRITTWVSSWLQNISYFSLFDKGEVPVINEISRMLSNSFLEIMAFLVLLLVTSRIIRLVGAVVSGIVAFSLLGPLDRLGGVIFGFLKGILILTVFVLILTPLQIYLEIIWDGSKYGQYFLDLWNSSMFIPYFKGFVTFVTNFAPGIPLNKFTQYIDI